MKILALNPPFLPRFSRSQRSPAVVKSGTLYYPIWLGYATGVLEQAGHEVELIDAPARELDLAAILERARQLQPRMIVVDASTPSFDNDVDVARALKELCGEGSRIVFVGTHVSATAEESLLGAPPIDVVARGEYDETLRHLAEVTERGGALADVPGISYRDDGEIQHTADRPLIADLDALPWVSKVWQRHLDHRDYFYSITQHPEITIVTSRGCPHHCAFCVYPQVLHGHKYRRRSAQDVVDELCFIERAFPDVKEVFVEDDTFTLDPRWIHEFCRLKQQSGCQLPWSANARVDLDQSTLRPLKAAGCRLLCVGFESGCQEVLDLMRKGTRVDAMQGFMEAARAAGILVHGCFICGNPGETKETFEQTVQLALRLAPDTAQFFPIMVYPGTAGHAHFSEQGWIRAERYRDWLTEEGWHNCVVETPDLSAAEMVRLCDEARDRFYLRPSYVLAKARQALGNPRELRRLVRGGFNLFGRYMLRRTKNAVLRLAPRL